MNEKVNNAIIHKKNVSRQVLWKRKKKIRMEIILKKKIKLTRNLVFLNNE